MDGEAKLAKLNSDLLTFKDFQTYIEKWNITDQNQDPNTVTFALAKLESEIKKIESLTEEQKILLLSMIKSKRNQQDLEWLNPRR